MENKTNRQEITSKVIDIIFSSLNLKHINKATVTESTAIVKEGLNLDSIDILELIVNFESSFGIKLSESEQYAKHFQNIGSVVDFIIAKQSLQQNNPNL